MSYLVIGKSPRTRLWRWRNNYMNFSILFSGIKLCNIKLKLIKRKCWQQLNYRQQHCWQQLNFPILSLRERTCGMYSRSIVKDIGTFTDWYFEITKYWLNNLKNKSKYVNRRSSLSNVIVSSLICVTWCKLYHCLFQTEVINVVNCRTYITSCKIGKVKAERAFVSNQPCRWRSICMLKEKLWFCRTIPRKLECYNSNEQVLWLRVEGNARGITIWERTEFQKWGKFSLLIFNRNRVRNLLCIIFRHYCGVYINWTSKSCFSLARHKFKKCIDIVISYRKWRYIWDCESNNSKPITILQ
jgi:hypothetical protein